MAYTFARVQVTGSFDGSRCTKGIARKHAGKNLAVRLNGTSDVCRHHDGFSRGWMLIYSGVGFKSTQSRVNNSRPNGHLSVEWINTTQLEYLLFPPLSCPIYSCSLCSLHGKLNRIHPLSDRPLPHRNGMLKTWGIAHLDVLKGPTGRKISIALDVKLYKEDTTYRR